MSTPSITWTCNAAYHVELFASDADKDLTHALIRNGSSARLEKEKIKCGILGNDKHQIYAEKIINKKHENIHPYIYQDKERELWLMETHKCIFPLLISARERIIKRPKSLSAYFTAKTNFELANNFLGNEHELFKEKLHQSIGFIKGEILINKLLKSIDELERSDHNQSFMQLVKLSTMIFYESQENDDRYQSIIKILKVLHESQASRKNSFEDLFLSAILQEEEGKNWGAISNYLRISGRAEDHSLKQVCKILNKMGDLESINRIWELYQDSLKKINELSENKSLACYVITNEKDSATDWWVEKSLIADLDFLGCKSYFRRGDLRIGDCKNNFLDKIYDSQVVILIYQKNKKDKIPSGEHSLYQTEMQMMKEAKQRSLLTVHLILTDGFSESDIDNHLKGMEYLTLSSYPDRISLKFSYFLKMIRFFSDMKGISKIKMMEINSFFKNQIKNYLIHVQNVEEIG